MSRCAPFSYLVLIFCAALFASACGDPPTREMDQAQGAIDAARAAGADRYATTEYQAAVDALKQAQDAVTARDYRLALNHALDSRDRAQSAAKQAAESQVTLRSGAERRLGEVTAMLAQSNERLKAAEAARIPRRSLTAPRAEIADAEAALQKAGTEINDGDYQASQGHLSDAAAKLRAAIGALDTLLGGHGTRPRR